MSIEQFLDYIRTSNIEEADRYLREVLRAICDRQKILCVDNIKVHLDFNWITDEANIRMTRNSEINVPYPEFLEIEDDNTRL